MSANYTIHFVGIVCIIKQSDAAVLVALPNGLKYDDPCTQQTLGEHRPYLIIPIQSIDESQVAGRIINHCFVIELADIQSIEFPDSMTSGPLDLTNPITNKEGYVWSEMDQNFVLDPLAPRNTILTIPLQQGTFLAKRIQGDDMVNDLPHISEVSLTTLAGPFDVLIDNTFKITALEGAEFVVANVEPGWLDGSAQDDPSDFNLYYSLCKTTTTPCVQPPVKKPTITTSSHPYLNDHRGLHIACSPTYVG